MVRRVSHGSAAANVRRVRADRGRAARAHLRQRRRRRASRAAAARARTCRDSRRLEKRRAARATRHTRLRRLTLYGCPASVAVCQPMAILPETLRSNQGLPDVAGFSSPATYERVTSSPVPVARRQSHRGACSSSSRGHPTGGLRRAGSRERGRPAAPAAPLPEVLELEARAASPHPDRVTAGETRPA
jgi:hypothetical protein